MGDPRNTEEEERTVCVVDETWVNPGEEGVLLPLDPWLGQPIDGVASYRVERHWAGNSLLFFT